MAIERMLRALGEYHVGGIATNVSLFRRILRDDGFRTANIDTGYLERLLAHAPTSAECLARQSKEAAAIAAAYFEGTNGPAPNDGESSTASSSAWKIAARREALRP
jgi:acetyl-CoA carboxylase, biotin carboxylase subunit